MQFAPGTVIPELHLVKIKVI
ncbi:hypothetical protein Aes012_124 [Aeromonas phage Aes012]|uniref:Uncharacterized protein n=1 Tax=Aeromonas phage Aes012 TaxID=1198014 RepID=I6YXT7_9CAUD|nr:hypothetical protein Aes012_124 [Aeromonas phage Aes012]AFN69754.1 hypothetical protein Aes012_124 [Aeromonas phage Aes012]